MTLFLIFKLCEYQNFDGFCVFWVKIALYFSEK